jgi:hypothetical protein
MTINCTGLIPVTGRRQGTGVVRWLDARSAEAILENVSRHEKI